MGWFERPPEELRQAAHVTPPSPHGGEASADWGRGAALQVIDQLARDDAWLLAAEKRWLLAVEPWLRLDDVSVEVTQDYWSSQADLDPAAQLLPREQYVEATRRTASEWIRNYVWPYDPPDFAEPRLRFHFVVDEPGGPIGW